MSMIDPIVAQINPVESILSFIVVVVLTFLLITWLMSFIRFKDTLELLNSEDVTDAFLRFYFTTAISEIFDQWS